MSTRRIVSSMLLVTVCALIVALGVANAGNGSAPMAELVPTQPVPAAQDSPTMDDILERVKLIGPTLERHPLPAQPGPEGWACPGTEGVQNIHVRLGRAPDDFAEGKSMGVTDDQARRWAAEIEAARRDLEQQMRNTLATLPPPPCP